MMYFSYDKAIADFRKDFPTEEKSIFFLTKKQKSFDDAFANNEDLQLLKHNHSSFIKEALENTWPCAIGEFEGNDEWFSRVKLVMPEIKDDKASFMPYVLNSTRKLIDIDLFHEFAFIALDDEFKDATRFMVFHHEVGHALTMGTNIFKEDVAPEVNEQLGECIAETYSYIRYKQHSDYNEQYASWHRFKRTLADVDEPESGHTFSDCLKTVDEFPIADLKKLSPRDTMKLAVNIAEKNLMSLEEIKDIGSVFYSTNAQLHFSRRSKNEDDFCYNINMSAMHLINVYKSDAINKPHIERYADHLTEAFSQMLPSELGFQSTLVKLKEQQASYFAGKKNKNSNTNQLKI